MNTPAPRPPTLAYLVSQLPALSHTFILREIMALSARGIDILPLSVNAPDRALHQLSTAEQTLAARTLYLKQTGLRTWLAAVVTVVMTRLPALLAALPALVRRGGTDARQWLWQLAYLLEAMLVGYQLQQHGIRHLHVHFATPAASVGVWCKELFGVSLSLTVHGPDEFSAAHHYRLAEKVAAADSIVCISQFCRSQLMLHSDPQHWHKLTVIPLGVDATPAATPPSRNGCHLVSIGRLAPAKGQMLLLTAFARLAAQRQDCHLTLIGTGPLEPAIRDYLQHHQLTQRVTLTGGLNHPEAMDYLASADLFVMASFAEGVPIVLMEAMARGIACVATRIAGIPELIEDRKSGLLVPAGDAEALYLAMWQLADNPSLAAHLGQAGRSQVMARYHIEHNADRLACHLRGLLVSQRDLVRAESPT